MRREIRRRRTIVLIAAALLMLLSVGVYASVPKGVAQINLMTAEGENVAGTLEIYVGTETQLTAKVLPYDQDFAVSGLRVFGPPQGPAPETVKAVTAETLGDRRLKLSWEPSSYAIGYRIRYGIRPDSLYGSVTVHETTSVELPLLHAGFHYFAAVDAFGEGGLAEGPAQRIS